MKPEPGADIAIAGDLLAAAVRRRGEIGRAYRDRLRWMFRPFTTTCVVLKRG